MGAGPGYPGYQVPQVPPPMGMAGHPGGPQYPMPPHQYGAVAKIAHFAVDHPVGFGGDSIPTHSSRGGGTGEQL